MNPHTQQFLCGRIGLLGKLECPCSSWMDVLLCISFLECASASPSCIFPEEIIWSALVLPFCIPSAFIAFSFLMTFAQCSISNMFQHRNHDDFATVAGVVVLLDSFNLCLMLNFYLICKVDVAFLSKSSSWKGSSIV